MVIPEKWYRYQGVEITEVDSTTCCGWLLLALVIGLYGFDSHTPTNSRTEHKPGCNKSSWSVCRKDVWETVTPPVWVTQILLVVVARKDLVTCTGGETFHVTRWFVLGVTWRDNRYIRKYATVTSLTMFFQTVNSYRLGENNLSWTWCNALKLIRFTKSFVVDVVLKLSKKFRLSLFWT